MKQPRTRRWSRRKNKGMEEWSNSVGKLMTCLLCILLLIAMKTGMKDSASEGESSLTLMSLCLSLRVVLSLVFLVFPFSIPVHPRVVLVVLHLVSFLCISCPSLIVRVDVLNKKCLIPFLHSFSLISLSVSLWFVCVHQSYSFCCCLHVSCSLSLPCIPMDARGEDDNRLSHCLIHGFRMRKKIETERQEKETCSTRIAQNKRKKDMKRVVESLFRDRVAVQCKRKSWGRRRKRKHEMKKGNKKERSVRIREKKTKTKTWFLSLALFFLWFLFPSVSLASLPSLSLMFFRSISCSAFSLSCAFSWCIPLSLSLSLSSSLFLY